MKRIYMLLAALTTVLTVNACGAFKSKKKDRNVAFGIGEIQGDWVNPCRKGAALQDNPFNLSSSLTIEGEKFSRTNSVWKFGACDELMYKKELHGTITQGGSSQGTYRLVSITVDSVQVTAYNKDIATAFNLLKYCEKTGWSVNESMMLDEVCKFFSDELKINAFQMPEGRLQFSQVAGNNGTASGDDSYSRPSTPGL